MRGIAPTPARKEREIVVEKMTRRQEKRLAAVVAVIVAAITVSVLVALMSAGMLPTPSWLHLR